MPFIEIQTEPTPEAVLYGEGLIEAELEIPVHLNASLIGEGLITAVLEGGFALVTLIGEGIISADIEVERNISSTLIGEGVISAELFIDRYQADFTFILDILPATAIPGTFIKWQPRLRVDGVEVPIIDGTFTQAEGVAADVLNIRLARVDDRVLFTNDAVIDFGFGIKTAGVWDEDSFEVCIADGRLQDLTYSIGMAEGPTDTASVSVISSARDKLMTTAEVDTIIYDSLRDSVDPADIEPIRDSAGRIFEPELVGIANLKLYNLFQEVLINRCGFSGYKTNLPNYYVSRISAEMGASLYEALGAHTGMFEPETFERDGVVWMIEMAQSMPPGFPAPLSVTVSQYQQLARSVAPIDVDAMRVFYSEYGFDYDYIFTDVDLFTLEEGDYEVRYDVRRHEFYRNIDPYNYVRRQKYFQRKEWYLGTVKIRETVENYEYDSRYRPSSTAIIVYDRMPDVTNIIAPEVPTLLNSARIDVANQWSTHPFDVTRQYRAKKTVRKQALIAQDNVNLQLGEPYRREYKEVWEDGNLTPEHTVYFDTVLTQTTTQRPKRDGTVEMTNSGIDEISGSIPFDEADDLAGDVSLNGMAMQPKSVLVFENDSSPRGTGQIVRMSVNELPLEHAKPLARRRMKRLRKGVAPIRVTLIGPHFALRKGMPFNPRGRNDEDLGQCIVTGRVIRFNMAQQMTDITCKEIG